MGGFCPGDFVQGDFVLGGILSRGILSGGFCPGGFCQGDFVLEPSWQVSSQFPQFSVWMILEFFKLSYATWGKIQHRKLHRIT